MKAFRKRAPRACTHADHDLGPARPHPDELEGWSALQFIESSSVTVHADEVFGRCFVDVFSCRRFDADVAAAIVAEHFGGTPTVTVLQR